MKSIIGFGSPLVDILAQEEDTFIKEHNLIKGGMELITADKAAELMARLPNAKKAPGGSAANTIVGTSQFGIKSGFCGKIGKDVNGEFFQKTYKRLGIQNHFFHSSQTSTGQATTIITPDAERSFGTFLGAALEFNADEISDNIFNGYSHAYVEGYLVANEQLIKKIFQTAKAQKVTTALDCASFNVIDENLNLFRNLIKDYVDILFVNEEESKSLTGETKENGIEKLSQMAETAVLKIGKEGSIIIKGNEITRVPAVMAEAVDTTGAGDLYASGFMAGLLSGKTLEECGRMGSIASSYVVRQNGAFMPEETWEKIKNACL